ncbi:unnamed protein product [Thlaspi arvense]|uniref:Uncharacterized protein n=1 Tax=Thlaspi arvense TaxID=13288 RepID=A0AAU9RHP9_THLAR|nr:unnamed protein product [Thlaspi arvense]
MASILDPTILASTPRGLEKFVDLAMSCLRETRFARPAMGEVVKEIENIMLIAGLCPMPNLHHFGQVKKDLVNGWTIL